MGARSFLSRLRQLTGRLTGFSFDKDPRRVSNASSELQATPMTPSRNNNADAPKCTGYCCPLSGASPHLKSKADILLANSARNRAYSLDVPTPRKRHSSSSGGGGSSRKSSSTSRNDNHDTDDAADNISQHQQQQQPPPPPPPSTMTTGVNI